MIEDQGHRWLAGDDTMEQCVNCGLTFFLFSFALQRGEIIRCEDYKNAPATTAPRVVVVDGITITGPEAPE